VLNDPVLVSAEKKPYPTVFHEIKNSSLPSHEKLAARLGDEAIVLIGAGGLTTADTLSLITFHILSNPAKLSRLKAELETAMPDPSAHLSWGTLERLPYLVRIL